MGTSRLRQRAVELRRLAGRLDTAPLLTLDRSGGIDTWQGPAADEFRLQVSRFQRRAGDAAAELRWQARHLDDRAAELEAAGMIAP